jgi:hypothetical protein
MGSHSVYTAPTGSFLASFLVPPVLFHWSFFLCGYSSALNMEAAGSPETMISTKLCSITFQRTVVLNVTAMRTSLLRLLQIISKFYRSCVMAVQSSSSGYDITLNVTFLLFTFFDISSDSSCIRTTDDRSTFSHTNVPFYKLSGRINFFLLK